MRYIFMGTPRFAAILLKDMTDAGRPPVGVMTQIDQPAGRGKKLTPPPVKLLAQKFDLPLLQPAKIGDNTRAWMKSLEPDICIVAAYGKILAPATLALAPHGCINAHASLLPRYRGAAPAAWAIINGETETGVTIMHVDEGSDTGDVILQESLPIALDDTTGSLLDKIAHRSGPLLIRAMDELAAGTALRIRQDDMGIEPNWAPRLTKKDGWIDWTRSARSIANQVRGTQPWPGAYTSVSDKTLKILEACEAPHVSGAPGEVLNVVPEGMHIGTGQGALLLTRVQMEGRRAMPCFDCMQGVRLEKGQRLGDG